MDDMRAPARAILQTLLITSVLAGNETLDAAFTYSNSTAGNRFWGGILKDCKTASLSCIQKNVYHYLDNTFTFRGDVSIGNFMHFKKNNVDYAQCQSNNIDDDAHEEQGRNFVEDEEESRSLTPLEEVTRALHNKSMGFLMTHDVEVPLPEMLFEGSTLKVSPRAFEGEGVLVKLDLIPKQIQEFPTGRIFFKKISKSPNDK